MMKLSSIVLLPFLLGGCGVIHQVNGAPSAPVDVPPQFLAAEDASGDTPSDPGSWWEGFGDPELNQLVSSAFGDNMDLRAAWARLAAADAASRGASSAYIPSVSLSGDVNYSRSVFNFGGGGPGGGGGAFPVEQSQVNLQAALSYEVDLWGRIYGLARAGAAELRASEQDLATMYITVSSSVVSTWLSAIEQRATLELLESQLASNQTYLELVEFRFRQGLTNALDVYQQRQQAAAIEARIPPAHASLDVTEHQLAVLLGRAPGTVRITRTALPTVPPLPEVGVPSVVLQQRPDVRAAQLRVVAADHRVGTAIANRFPRITLSGSAGFRGFDVVSGLFDNWLFNLVAGLTQPLTDQVRLEAEERQARARLEEQVANYGRTVLTALREVEDALVQEVRQDDLLKELREQVELGRATLSEAQNRYRNGLSDYLPVLSALQTLQNSEQSLVAAERQRLSIRVQLYRALGGAWMNDGQEPLTKSSPAERVEKKS